MTRAGFESVGIGPTRIYTIEDAREFRAGKGVDVDALAPHAVRDGDAFAVCCTLSATGYAHVKGT